MIADVPAYRRYFLKAKIKSLAAEAWLLQQDETKLIRLARKRAAKSKSRANLDRNHAGYRHHRKQVVQPEARHSQLAYGFLRGTDYTRMEQAIYTVPSWDRVENIVRRFADDDWRVVGQRWAAWKDAAAQAAGANFEATAKKAINKRAMSRATHLWLSTPEGQAERQRRKDEWNGNSS